MKPVNLASLLLLSVWLMPYQAIASEKIRFAPLPMESLESMTQEYLPFMDFLEKNVNTPFELVYKTSYQDLISSFINGKIDLAYLGPLPYVLLKEKLPDTTPLVQFLDSEGKSNYTCSVIEFAGDPVDMSSKKVKKVALTQPLSTCGYLSTESILNQNQYSLEQPYFDYQFIGNHIQVAEQVVLGNYQLGGLKTDIGKKYHYLGIRIVSETNPMPGFLMVANAKTLTTKQIADIKSLILSIQPHNNPDHFEQTKPWGAKIKYGAIPANDNDYNSVRERWKHTKIDLMQ